MITLTELDRQLIRKVLLKRLEDCELLLEDCETEELLNQRKEEVQEVLKALSYL